MNKILFKKKFYSKLSMGHLGQPHTLGVEFNEDIVGKYVID